MSRGASDSGANETAASSFRRATTAELVASRPDPAHLDATRLPVIVVLDNVRSADNVGLMFRLCDCVNVQALWLTGITAYPGVSPHVDNRLHKTGVGGSLQALPWRYVADPVPDVQRLRSDGWRILVLEQGAGAVHWRAAAYDTPLVLIVGHEREGVTQGLLDTADQVIELPMRGVTNSLNVALCAAVVLYEVLARLEPDGQVRQWR